MVSAFTFWIHWTHETATVNYPESAELLNIIIKLWASEIKHDLPPLCWDGGRNLGDRTWEHKTKTILTRLDTATDKSDCFICLSLYSFEFLLTLTSDQGAIWSVLKSEADEKDYLNFWYDFLQHSLHELRSDLNMTSNAAECSRIKVTFSIVCSTFTQAYSGLRAGGFFSHQALGLWGDMAWPSLPTFPRMRRSCRRRHV